jgi:pimeloyl-ACP methyl ester carboxylesterase
MRPIHRRGALLLLTAIVTFAGGTLYTLLNTRRAESAHPPEGQFITVDGTRLHYVQHGTGPPVLLLHGNPGFVQDWARVLPQLAPRYRALAFDRPGHGYSTRPAASGMTPALQARQVHTALERLHVGCPIVVGHSWGGALALIYAVEYPEDVCGLVVIGTRAFALGRTDSLAYRLVRTPVIGDLLRYSVMPPIARRMIREGMTVAYDPDVPRPDDVAAASAFWSRPGQVEATVWDTRNLQEALPSFSPRYADIKAPVTILVGDLDTPGRESIPLSRLIPGAELVVIPRTGHMIPHLRPAAVVAAIDSVMARHR